MNESECRFCCFKSQAVQLLSVKELETLGQNCAKINFQKGDVIFREGTLATNIVYLRNGLVKLHMTGPTGIKIIRLMKAPCFLGLPTKFGEKINHYSTTSITDTEVCFISLDIFKDFIVSNGHFAYEIIIELCKNEIKDHKRCTNMTQKQVPGRLAEILLCMSEEIFESNVFEIPLNNTELSSFISTSRESVSRILNEFVKEGIINLNGRKITIQKKDTLLSICQNG